MQRGRTGGEGHGVSRTGNLAKFPFECLEMRTNARSDPIGIYSFTDQTCFFSAQVRG